MDYNSYMGGVDHADQSKSFYAVGRKARRWWKYIMWFLINVSINNAHLVRRASPTTGLSPAQLTMRKPMSHKDFRFALVEQLIAGYSGNKRQLSRGAKVGLSDVPIMTCEVAISHICEKSPKSRTCYWCSRQTNTTEKGLPVRTTGWCAKCDRHLCYVKCFNQYHAQCCGVMCGTLIRDHP